MPTCSGLGDYIPLEVGGSAGEACLCLRAALAAALGAGNEAGRRDRAASAGAVDALAGRRFGGPAALGADHFWEDTQVVVEDAASFELGDLFTGRACAAENSRRSAAVVLPISPWPC